MVSLIEKAKEVVSDGNTTFGLCESDLTFLLKWHIADKPSVGEMKGERKK